MNCNDSRALWLDLRDGLLQPRLAAQVRDHLNRCPACGREQAGLEQALTALREEGAEPVPEDFAERVLESVEAARKAPRRSSAPVPVGAGSPGRETARRLGAPRPRAALFRVFAAAAAALLLAGAIALGREWGRRDESMRAAAGLEAFAGLKDRLEAAERNFEASELAFEGAEKAFEAERLRLQADAAAQGERSSRLEADARSLREEIARFRAGSEETSLALADLRRSAADTARERDLLKRELDAARPPAAPRPGQVAGQAAGQVAAQAAGQAAAAPSSPSLAPALAVGLDRRRGEARDLSIDLRGPDSRVVPRLIALCQGEDDELGNLALRLLRERLQGILSEDEAQSASFEEDMTADSPGPARSLLQSMSVSLGHVREELSIPGVRSAAPVEAPAGLSPVLSGSERKLEADKIQRIWRAHILGSREGAAERL